MSRGLTGAEKNYSVPELECLAVVWAIKKFGHYIEFMHFTIETDHQALKWLRNLREPGGRLARWALQLQGLDFSIQYRKGSTNQAADALSRNPVDAVKAEEGRVEVLTTAVVRDEFPTREEFIHEQNMDETWSAVRRYLGEGDLPENRGFRAKVICLAKDCMLDHNLLVKYYPPKNEKSSVTKIVVPKSQRYQVIQQFHDHPLAGHYGRDKTIVRVQREYTWPGVRKDVKRYCRVVLVVRRASRQIRHRVGRAMGSARG